jgi:hypothetical protein
MLYVLIVWQEGFEDDGMDRVEAIDISVCNGDLYPDIISRLPQPLYLHKADTKMLHTRVQ